MHERTETMGCFYNIFGDTAPYRVTAHKNERIQRVQSFFFSFLFFSFPLLVLIPIRYMRFPSFTGASMYAIPPFRKLYIVYPSTLRLCLIYTVYTLALYVRIFAAKSTLSLYNLLPFHLATHHRPV